MREMKKMLAIAATAGIGMLAAASAANAQYVFGDFENGTTNGFGYLSQSSGVQPFPATPGPTASIITPTSGADTTQVLDINGAGFNGGQENSGTPYGSDIGYDFAANGLTAQFMANDVITFQWEAGPNTSPSGYSQLYNITFNVQGFSETNVGGSGGSTDTAMATVTGPVNQYPPFSGQLNTVSVNYDALKASILAGPDPNPAWIQFAIQTNNGGGASTEMYFDNFTLSQVPEPASLGLMAMGGLALLRRRRRA